MPTQRQQKHKKGFIYETVALQKHLLFQKPLRRVAILHAKLQLFFELCKKKEAYYILLLRNDIL